MVTTSFARLFFNIPVITGGEIMLRGQSSKLNESTNIETSCSKLMKESPLIPGMLLASWRASKSDIRGVFYECRNKFTLFRWRIVYFLPNEVKPVMKFTL